MDSQRVIFFCDHQLVESHLLINFQTTQSSSLGDEIEWELYLSQVRKFKSQQGVKKIG